jgi:hypothetical protein
VGRGAGSREGLSSKAMVESKAEDAQGDGGQEIMKGE